MMDYEEVYFVRMLVQIIMLDIDIDNLHNDWIDIEIDIQ